MTATPPSTGIVNHPERRQPYTVWFMGNVILFTASLAEAEHALTAARAAAAVRNPYAHP
jgi:hypothetical protein